MRRRLRVFFIVLGAFTLASLLALYGYGRFAERARGEESHALPVGEDGLLDHAVAPLLEQHPNETGMALLPDNVDAFAIRVVTARAAIRSLDLQYYIWHADFTGDLLHKEVLRAADRGVRVRLLLDDLSTQGAGPVLAALDSHPRIEVRLFNPTRVRAGVLRRGLEMLLRAFSVNRRMHNKAWIADGRLAVVGGRNIGDEYFDADPTVNFRDTDVLLLGPAVEQTSSVFDAFWNSRSAIPLQALTRTPEGALEELRAQIDATLASTRAHPYVRHLLESQHVQELFDGKRAIHWSPHARVVADPPEKAEGSSPTEGWLTPVLLDALAQVSRDLKLISPYFVPGESGVGLLRALRERGASVGVLTNSLAANDVVAVHGGYAKYRVPLLAADIALYELMPNGRTDSSWLGSSGASLHTKAIVADGEIGFVGSYNIDPRSMNLNTEMGLLFRDAGLARELEVLYVEKTAAQVSYRVYREGDELRWSDGSVEPPRVWDHEPEAGLARRWGAWIVGWLPVESQL